MSYRAICDQEAKAVLIAYKYGKVDLIRSPSLLVYLFTFEMKS